MKTGIRKRKLRFWDAWILLVGKNETFWLFMGMFGFLNISLFDSAEEFPHISYVSWIVACFLLLSIHVALLLWAAVRSIPLLLSGWKYTDRQDDSIPVDILTRIAALQKSFSPLLLFPLSMHYLGIYFGLAAVLFLSWIVFYLNLREYSTSKSKFWSLKGQNVLAVGLIFFVMSQCGFPIEIFALILFLLFIPLRRFFLHENRELSWWISKDSFTSGDAECARRLGLVESKDLNKCNVEDDYRNILLADTAELRSSVATTSLAWLGEEVAPEGFDVEIAVDGTTAWKSSLTALEKGWNEVRLPAGKKVSLKTDSAFRRSLAWEAPMPHVGKSVQKDVIVVVCDALTYADLGLVSSSGVDTPHLREFFDEGLFCQNALVQGEWTTTNFAHMLTGCYSSTHCATHRYESPKKIFPNNISTMPELLQKSGFRTHLFSCSKRLSPSIGYLRGFDRTTVRDYRTVMNHELTYRAVDWLDQSSGDNFLMLHYMDTHGPFNFWSHYRDHGFSQKSKAVGDVWRRTDPEIFDEIYRHQIHEFDLGMGVLLRYIEKRMQEREVTVILTADHGQMHRVDPLDPIAQREPLLSRRMLHVPLVWGGNAFHGGGRQVVEGLVEAGVDLKPSLLDYLGIPCDDCDGSSYWSQRTGKSVAIAESIYEGILQRRMETENHIHYSRFDWTTQQQEELLLEARSPYAAVQGSSSVELKDWFRSEALRRGLVDADSDPLDYYGPLLK